MLDVQARRGGFATPSHTLLGYRRGQERRMGRRSRLVFKRAERGALAVHQHHIEQFCRWLSSLLTPGWMFAIISGNRFRFRNLILSIGRSPDAPPGGTLAEGGVDGIEARCQLHHGWRWLAFSVIHRSSLSSPGYMPPEPGFPHKSMVVFSAWIPLPQPHPEGDAHQARRDSPHHNT